jgi:hypothetical protein
MAEQFVDRKSNKPNRYKITKADGSTEYVTLERADEPTVVGTPLNANTFNGIINDMNGKVEKAGGTMTGVLNSPKIHMYDSRYPHMTFGDSSSVTGQVHQDFNTGEFCFRQISLENGCFDDLKLPAPTKPMSANYAYVIYTSRDPLILREGVHFGDTLPPAGTPGRIFFRSVSG